MDKVNFKIACIIRGNVVSAALQNVSNMVSIEVTGLFALLYVVKLGQKAAEAGGHIREAFGGVQLVIVNCNFGSRCFETDMRL